MKKLVFSLIVSSIILASCIKNDKESCNNCKNNVPIESELIFGFGNDSISANIEYWVNKSITLTYKTIKDRQFDKIVSLLANETNFDKDPYGVVLFTNQLLSNNRTVLKNNIIGIGYYFLEDDKMYFHFYQKNGETFELISDLNCEVEGVISNDLNSIALNCFDSSKYPGRSWILLFSDSNIQYNLKQPKHKLTNRLIEHLSLKNTTAPNCEAPCIDNGLNPCHISPLYGTTCNGEDEKPCLDQSIKSFCVDNVISFDTSTFNYVLHNQFKNNFLQTSVTGQALIDDYYMLSEYYQPKLSVQLASNTVLVLFNINYVLNIILSNDSNTIAITNELAVQIKNLIDSYIAITESPEIILKLQQYKFLIDENTGLTGDQVHL